MTKPPWSLSDIPDQRGRTAIITGATSGLGEETTRALANKGAQVVMAVRNTAKGESVAAAIRTENREASVSVAELDLCSLASIESFAATFLNDHNQLDLLINNAGVMMCPYSKTSDGFEIQMGTNHLGHFALTGRLMEPLVNTANSRVVTVSSLAHKSGKINFDDVNWDERRYNTFKAYFDSKLANLHFVYELAHRLADKNDAPLIVAAHPGVARTELTRHSKLTDMMVGLIAQNSAAGALPTLRAAVDPDANSADYYGPGGLFEMSGPPKKVGSSKWSKDTSARERLWTLSEELTEVRY